MTLSGFFGARARRASGAASVALLALVAPACADDAAPAKKIVIPPAASLIGKTIDPDLGYEISQQAKSSTSGDWLYGFTGGAEGELLRGAWSKPNAKAGTLTVSISYDRRCDPKGKALPLSLDDDPRRFVVPERKSGSGGAALTVPAWIVYGDGAGFSAPAPKPKTMSYQDMDGMLLFTLDRDALAPHDALALCPSLAATKKAAASCSVFSLKGFARALDYACEAK